MKKALAILAVLLAPVVLYWLAVYALGLSRAWLTGLLPVAILAPALAVFVYDNVQMMRGRLWKFLAVLPQALFALLPVLLVSAPGILLVLWIEHQAYAGADRCHRYCQDQIVQQENKIRREVDKVRFEDASVWYKPWTYDDKVRVKYKEVQYDLVKSNITVPAKQTTRLAYGSLVSLLDLLVIASRTMVGALLLSSFLYIYSQILICKASLRVKY